MKITDNRQKNVIINNLTKYIVTLWCVLPVYMSICILMLGITGQFPQAEVLETQGFTLGNIYYSLTLNIYRTVYYVLGFLTVIAASFQVVVSLPKRGNRRTILARPWFLFLGILLVWALLCSILADDFSTALLGEFYLNDGFLSYCIYAAVFICAASVFREKSRCFIMRLYSAVVCYLALIMVLQQFGIDFLDYCFPGARSVVFNQFNHFGYILCMAVMALWGLYIYDTQAKSWLKALYLTGFAFLSYSLMLNDTFGAYLAVLAALPIVYVFYFVSGRRAKDWQGKLYVFAPLILFLLLSAVNMAGWLPFTDSLSENVTTFGSDLVNTIENNEEAARAGTGRLTLWKDTIERIKERPIFGFGPMGFTGEHAISYNDSTHNEYLQIAGFLGIPGLLLYLAALLSLFVHHWKRMKQLDPMVLAVSGCTVGYLISACFGNPVFNTAPYFWMFLGLTTCTSEQEGSPFALTDESLGRLKSSKVSLKKILPVLLAVAAVFGGVVLAVHYFTAVSEQDKELADLQNMQCADLTGQVLLKNGALEETAVYWYDAEKLSFLGEDEEKPAAYGEGTSSPGGGLAAFAEECDTTYDYDESADYTGKILAVTVDPAASTVTLAWVDAE